MKNKSGLLSVALFSAAILGVASANASDPVGVYAYVDKVVIEPSEGKPERIQIWGGFALADGRGDNYAKAKPGYMYFTLKPGEEEICRKEWKDLKSMAGKDEYVAFGARFKPRGTVRSANTKPEKPDIYPTGFGLTRIKKQDYGPIKDLAELRKKNSDKAVKTAALR